MRNASTCETVSFDPPLDPPLPLSLSFSPFTVDLFRHHLYTATGAILIYGRAKLNEGVAASFLANKSVLGEEEGDSATVKE